MTPVHSVEKRGSLPNASRPSVPGGDEAGDADNNWRWERRGCRVYSATWPQRRPLKVADVAIGGLDEDGIDARGRLIAAAPDLLEACLNLRGLYDTPTERRRRNDDPFYNEAVEVLRAAIAKATTPTTQGGRDE